MPEFLLASEYEKSGTLPECRPSSPFSSGPILFCASSPMEWQGRHLWNEISPLAASCADAVQADAAINAAATITVLIISSPFRLSYRSRPWRPQNSAAAVQAAGASCVNG